MAVVSIAGARSAGKSAFDRAAILRDAHTRARWSYATGRGTYRECLAQGMRDAWEAHKALAADRLAAQIPADVVRQISDLRIIAGAQSLTAYGAENRRLILAEAEDIEQAARCVMIPAQQDLSHVAH